MKSSPAVTTGPDSYEAQTPVEDWALDAMHLAMLAVTTRFAGEGGVSELGTW